ncbi:MAG: aminotransferase class I/II-fold pyridoxal phosphate-dependent enzyme [Halobacteriovoraceae bacterium]|nr:aminotransferase class I/II-fold pyridoxal phosphate-dependent enzyme [Halobacteriovoraceae bacterium]
MSKYSELSSDELKKLEMDLLLEHRNFVEQGLSLDLTRGKPSTEQVALSDKLDGILDRNFQSKSGVDVRNYGGLDGLPEMKELASAILETPKDNIIIGGNSSLTLMHQVISMLNFYGKDGDMNGQELSWKAEFEVKFLCPVPGYDRHFTICESMGIEMIKVPLKNNQLDIDLIETLVREDSSIKGIWCVPKYSNPTGITYSDEIVERIAKLPKISGENFAIMWDNAYAVHDLYEEKDKLKCIWELCADNGTLDSLYIFGSTSKITFPGAGIAFMATSSANLIGFKRYLSAITIGPDKVNQLRHCVFLKNKEALLTHMKKHAKIIRPKFELVEDKLSAIADLEIAEWTKPKGGYFISFNTLDNLANRVVKLAQEAGVKLTPAGSTFPNMLDPMNNNIRIAPTYPTKEDLGKAIDVFVTCVKLASVEKLLNNME